MSSWAARYLAEIAGNAAPSERLKGERLSGSAIKQSVSTEDEALIAAIACGDREALGFLFRRYARLVRSLACRILRDPSEADDLVQDVFLFIHEKSCTFDGSKSSGRSWIVQVTYSRAIDRRRYLASRHFYSRIDIDEAGPELSDPRTGTPVYDCSLEALLGTDGMRKLEESLTPDQSATIRLFFFEGCTFEEIAERLGQSVGNIRNHYYRGPEKMRKLMFPTRLRAQ